MYLDKSKQYIFVIGSDNQHRIFWDQDKWKYEFLAGSVLFDEQTALNPEAISEIISFHGLTLDQFSVDDTGKGRIYAEEVRKKIKSNEERGIAPCAKHGLSAKNDDGTCEACQNADYFDDFKGTEG